jgi:hypothetical protein
VQQLADIQSQWLLRGGSGGTLRNSKFKIHYNSFALKEWRRAKMSEKLWFISEDSDVIAVFDDHEVAREELFYLKEDDPTGKFKVYGLTLSEFYSDEYDLAISEGMVAV